MCAATSKSPNVTSQLDLAMDYASIGETLNRYAQVEAELGHPKKSVALSRMALKMAKLSNSGLNAIEKAIKV